MLRFTCIQRRWTGVRRMPPSFRIIKLISSSVEATYIRKSPVEHILLRPGMYVGQTNMVAADMWTYNQPYRTMEKAPIHYCPALLKVFDEILINAADNVQRDKKTRSIKVTARRSDDGKGLRVSIYNDGKGIPVELHKKEQLHVPELIFGHLLTGSNFDDRASRLTGGSHGFGAKLTNIFSDVFEVETYDAKRKKLYKQRWEENMSSVSKPIIQDVDLPHDYTIVSFQPDLSKFALADTVEHIGSNEASSAAISGGSVHFDNEDVISQVLRLYEKRTVDVAGCVAPTSVHFNNDDVPIPVHSFQDYAQLYQARPMIEPASAQAVYGKDDGTPDSTTSDLQRSFAPGSDHVASYSDGGALPTPVDYSEISGSSKGVCFKKINARWEVGVGLSSTETFEQVSFVNNVWTVRGGTHVNAIMAQLTRAFETALQKAGVKAASSASIIRSKIMLFVNSRIENPGFEGQTKDLLNTAPDAWGSPCKLPDSFLKQVVTESGIMEAVMADIAMRDRARLVRKSKSSSKKQMVDVPKLEDAHLAGTSESSLDCTLILTEGDSAKALAVAGLEVVGRSHYGVMPLRGKLLNVRSASRAQLSKNKEFFNICKALGLDLHKTYEHGLESEGLRYGKVLIMCDQDHDGSHIKGLVINLFHHFWPALLKHEGFLQQFITPIVKVRNSNSNSASAGVNDGSSGSSKVARGQKSRKGGAAAQETLSFYSLQEFNEWRTQRQIAHDSGIIDMPAAGGATATGGANTATSLPLGKKLSVKYYKGLGTSTASEGREYFKALEAHRKVFQASSSADEDAIDLAFAKQRSSDRREWITSKFDAAAYVDPRSEAALPFEDFINKELIHFSYADIHRSIPSVIDGLKPSQRKVLFGCFKKKLHTDEAKVVQIAGYIAEHTAYHHGEASLHATIINMAQDYVGANNAPLLRGIGQFGTRAQNGKDFASPRYIFTQLSPVSRLLFPEADDCLLQRVEEDNQLVEPHYYVPVLPVLLLNGAQGIGTGWSTSVPQFLLPDVLEQVRHRIAGTTPPRRLEPRIEGYTGSIQPVRKRMGNAPAKAKSAAAAMATSGARALAGASPESYLTVGRVREVGKGRLQISELPHGQSTEGYKNNVLCKLLDTGLIKDFKEFHTTDTVNFEVTLSDRQLEAISSKKGGLKKGLQLTSTISMKNMHAFDREGMIQKFDSPEEIVDAHFDVRLQAYELRKRALERKYAAEELKSRNKSRFLGDILRGDISILGNALRVTSPGAGLEAEAGVGSADARAVSEVGLLQELVSRGYASQQEIARLSDVEGLTAIGPAAAVAAGSTAEGGGDTEDVLSRDAGVGGGGAGGSDYSYLLNLSIYSLTEERSQALHREAEEAQRSLQAITARSAVDLWSHDLDRLSEFYENTRRGSSGSGNHR